MRPNLAKTLDASLRQVELIQEYVKSGWEGIPLICEAGLVKG